MGEKILIVDDSPLMHQMYEAIFHERKAAGASLIHANNGSEAFERLADHSDVDIILLDINMPIMNGLEFLGRRRRDSLHLEVPVVIVSTEDREDDTVRGLQAGASAYVFKPFRPDELRQVVGRVLGSTSS